MRTEPAGVHHNRDGPLEQRRPSGIGVRADEDLSAAQPSELGRSTDHTDRPGRLAAARCRAGDEDSFHLAALTPSSKEQSRIEQRAAVEPAPLCRPSESQRPETVTESRPRRAVADR